MSAPDTNLHKQKVRHRGPLMGIAAVLAVVVVLFVGYLAYVADTGDEATVPPTTEATPAESMPAEGIPVTPMTTPDAGPQVTEPVAPPPTD